MDKKPNIYLEHVQERFPEWQTELATLFEQEPEFRELCQDYATVVDNVEHWEQHHKHTGVVTQNWLALLRELEAELVEVLNTQRRGYAAR